LVVGGRPGLKVTEAAPVVREGAYWCWLRCLSLLRAKWYAGDGDSTSFEMWTPKGMDELCALMPLLPDTARLLWHEQLWPDPNSVEALALEKQGGHRYKPGDVILVPEDGRLWFVGPDTNSKRIHVLADWKVNDAAIWMGHVYQSGPPLPGELTRLERIAKDDD
jgi:hypothetical protein